MKGECDIVDADRGRRIGGVARRMLGADRGRPVEEGVREEIEEEAEGVDEGEVERGADGGAPAEVEDGLQVERDRPAEEAGGNVRGDELGRGKRQMNYVQPQSLDNLAA